MSARLAVGSQPRARPEALAALHAEAFHDPTTGAEPWSAGAFQAVREVDDLIWVEAFASEGAESPIGFALFRLIPPESELLTLARSPRLARTGLGRRLLRAGVEALRTRDVETVFLEVAARNRAARRLYSDNGFTPVGHRPRYYRATDGVFDDALLLALSIGNSCVLSHSGEFQV